MNNHTKNAFFVLSVLIVLLCIHCREEHPGRKIPRATTNAGVPFYLQIRATVGGADLLYDSIYHTIKSRAFTVNDFRYYISNVQAIRDDGTVHTLSCPVILVSPYQKNYNMGMLPEGSYKELRLTLGLDSALNHCDPTVFKKDHPLAIQTPSMHWDWNSGYLFMKVEGRVDTTKKSIGAPATEFFYHIGMDRMKRVIYIQTRFSITKSSENKIRLQFDLARMLATIDIQSEILTHSFDNLPLADRIADSWQEAFSVDN